MMTKERTKEIEALRARLAALEEEQKKEEKDRESMENAHQQLLSSLEANGLALEAFVRAYFDDFRKIVAKIEKQEARKNAAKTGMRKRRSRKRGPAITIKIPAGKYQNIPSEPDKVFVVKEKGPRPKALKEYAQKVGLDTFMEQCRVS